MDPNPILTAILGVAAFGLILYLQISRGMYKTGKKSTPEGTIAVAKTTDEVIVDHVSLDDLQGLWRLVSLGRNGRFAPKEMLARAPMTIAIVRDTLTNTGTLTMSTIKINSDVVPNQLDQMDEDGDVHLCIARLRNGQLEMCQAEVGKPRPLDFNPKRRDGASLVLFERIETGENFSQKG